MFWQHFNLSVSFWHAALKICVTISDVKDSFNTHLPTLFSIPVYFRTLNKPERVPRKAVSIPSSILREGKEKEEKEHKAEKENWQQCRWNDI